jgi:hypothetical protein
MEIGLTVFPHAPQLLLSVFLSTHVVSQSSCPSMGHLHEASSHALPASHYVPRDSFKQIFSIPAESRREINERGYSRTHHVATLAAIIRIARYINTYTPA